MKRGDHYRSPLIACAVVCALLLILLLIFIRIHNDRPLAQPQTTDSAELAKLATLPIKGRAPKTGYDRSLFGPAWTDNVTVAAGHNGCDTRNDILRRDLVEVEIKPGTNGCTVLAGCGTIPTLTPRSSSTAAGARPGKCRSTTSSHCDAWQKGAQQWDAAKRRDFANDPINLQATTRAMNEQKRDGDAATWLPPNKSYRCTYVSRIVETKATYGLWVTRAEHDAIARILNRCGATAGQLPKANAPASTAQKPVIRPSGGRDTPRDGQLWSLYLEDSQTGLGGQTFPGPRGPPWRAPADTTRQRIAPQRSSQALAVVPQPETGSGRPCNRENRSGSANPRRTGVRLGAQPPGRRDHRGFV